MIVKFRRVEIMLDHAKIAAQEEKHRDYVLTRFGDFIGLFEGAFDIFLLSLEESKYCHNAGKNCDYHKVYLSMCMKINSDIRTIYTAIINGWYRTAHTLFRDIHEALLKIAYISSIPEDSALILNGKLRQKDIKKKVREINITPPIADREWIFLSNLKHAEGKQVWAYGQITDNNVDLRFIPTFYAKDVETLFVFSSGLILSSAIYYWNFHVKNYGESFQNPTFSNNLYSYKERINELLKSEID
jgi:hypothetical protein